MQDIVCVCVCVCVCARVHACVSACVCTDLYKCISNYSQFRLRARHPQCLNNTLDTTQLHTYMHIVNVNNKLVHVTRSTKRSLIYVSNFGTLKRHNSFVIKLLSWNFLSHKYNNLKVLPRAIGQTQAELHSHRCTRSLFTNPVTYFLYTLKTSYTHTRLNYVIIPLQCNQMSLSMDEGLSDLLVVQSCWNSKHDIPIK